MSKRERERHNRPGNINVGLRADVTDAGDSTLNRACLLLERERERDNGVSEIIR